MVRRVLLLLSAFALSACGGVEEPELGPLIQPRSLAEVVTPVEAYIGTAAQRGVLTQAEDHLVRECMRGLRLDWPVDPPRVLRTTSQAWDLGYADADATAAYGYHPPWLAADLAVSVGGTEEPRTVSGAARAAYAGLRHPDLEGKAVPDGGCAAQARRRLDEGAPAADTGEALRIADQAGMRALDDTRVVAVTQRWARCMSGRGFSYRSPYEARDDVRWNETGSTPSAEEIRTAVADRQCRDEVGYVGVRLAVITAYQNGEIDRRGDLFRAVQQQLHHRLRVAEAVLR